MKSKTTERGYSRELGQFFSPEKLVNQCIQLRKNKGRLLEPSCGTGAFNKCKDKNSVFIEIDKKLVKDPDVIIQDFFDYPLSEKFDTIIGNPPYVDNSLFEFKHETGITCQANLYLYFIEKCYLHLNPHGEIIFIVPREFIKLTSARYVNNLLWNNGTITHYYDYGDEKLFTEACPNVCIFRFEKDNFGRKTKTFNGELFMHNNDGLISFTEKNTNTTLGDLFDIKVGAVSGADKIFEHKDGCEFVCSKTRKTNELRKMLYRVEHKDLIPYKETLLKRGIKKFDNENWFDWGRPVNFEENRPRIYVNCKTRINNPFFINSCKKWDGSILALFPKKEMDLEKATRILNAIDWESLGFMTGGRYLFAQKSLKEAPVDASLFE